MHFFYIIFSDKTNRYYYGSSHEPEVRLNLHNSGATPSTIHGIPWRLVYSEKYETKTEAIKREKEIKRMKNRKYIEALISNKNG